MDLKIPINVSFFKFLAFETLLEQKYFVYDKK